jgi:L-lactate dehydrogenase complex protein LldF
MVKSKSMLTEECHLNEFLQENGVEWWTPIWVSVSCSWPVSHPAISCLPCIHKKKEEIGEIFHEHLGTPAGNADPQFLTHAARCTCGKNSSPGG